MATNVKLNTLAQTAQLVPLPGTFAAVVSFCEQYSQKSGGNEGVVGTLAAALAEGASDFWSPVLPRGLRLNTAEEVFEADLDAQRVRVRPAAGVGDPTVIVSGHAGTREILARCWPMAIVVEGNVSPDDIAGKVVVGTLPPHLVAEAGAYVPVSVREFDYSRDGDLAGEELRERLVIGEPITVTIF